MKRLAVGHLVVRAAVVLLILALVVPALARVELPPRVQEIDSDGDGKNDIKVKDSDTDGDECPEDLQIDTNMDGKYDMGLGDADGNQRYDRKWVDNNGDGEVDISEVSPLQQQTGNMTFVDINLDGRFDVVVKDGNDTDRCYEVILIDNRPEDDPDVKLMDTGIRDTNGDGVYDDKWLDANGDGQPQAGEWTPIGE